MLKGKNILVGVTGGIAAYKAVDLVSKLKKKGANVQVIMTEAATEFVKPLTFQTMSQNIVYVDIFAEVKAWEVEHISLAEKADLILVAPATANTIGKIANGIADDMLSTVIMATESKVIFAPAMNTHMYSNPIVEENMKKLTKLDYEFIEPGSGLLACGTYGAGRMAENVDIIEYVEDFFKTKDLKDKKFVITAGPTIEPLDPVRYMTNFSSGKMGYALAEEAKKRGGEVILITGPTSLKPPKGVKVVNIKTTEEMFHAVEDEFNDSQVLIKAAAPLDYRPSVVSDSKIKKNKDTLEMKFVKNPDIAMHFGTMKKSQIMVGFAAETQNLIENATEKMKRKNFDFIVANDVSKEGAGFETDTNIVSIIDRHEKIEKHPIMEKNKLASIILDKVVQLLIKG